MTDSQDLTASTPWETPGALVIRRHLGETTPALSPAVLSVEPGLSVNQHLVDTDFLDFVVTYAQRRGHLSFGAIFELAEAWGMPVEGEYALCSAYDPNCVIWPRATLHYLRHLISLLRFAPETASAHEVDARDDALAAGFTPDLPPVDIARYNSEQPQTEPRWLPAVLCAKRAGLGLKQRASASTIENVLRKLVGDLPASARESMNVSVSVELVDKDGNVVTRMDGPGTRAGTSGKTGDYQA